MNEKFPGNYAYLEILWWFSGINVFMMTFPIFITIQKLQVKSSPWLSRVASMTFGIYLCHFVFVQMGYDLYSRILPEAVPTSARIMLNAISVFAVCYGLVRVLSTTKFTRKLVA
jgi:surface polysaccharide O-acyltransferase-like enzyme